MRSGVNCTRLNSTASAADNALTSRVFAVPGTPSSSTCPRTRSAETRPESVPSCPTTTLPTSSRRATIAARGSPDGLGGMSMEHLFLQRLDVARERDETFVGCDPIVAHHAGGAGGLDAEAGRQHLRQQL